MDKKELESLLERAEKVTEKVDSFISNRKSEDSNTMGSVVSGSGSYNYGGSRMGFQSDEAKAMAAFRCKNAAELMRVNTGAPQFASVKPEYKQLVLDLKRDVDTARFINQFFNGGASDRVGGEGQDYISNQKSMKDLRFFKEVVAPRAKAFDTVTDAAWVPTILASNYVDEFQLKHVVEPAFKAIQMGSKTHELPVKDNNQKARIAAENGQMTSSKFGTSKITMSAVKLAEYHEITEEMNEDSAPDIIAAARENVILSNIRAVESAIINGDNDGTHIDSDTQAGAADLAEKSWKGLRALALANAGASIALAGSAVTEATLRTLRSTMKRFGTYPTDLAWICGPVVYQQLLTLPGVATYDKWGDFATNRTGVLANYQGIPILTSEHMREDLNATGVYDGVTTTQGAILLVNVKRFFMGVRRPIMVKAMNDLADYDRFLLAAYQRKDFKGVTQSADEKSVVYGYDITL